MPSALSPDALRAQPRRTFAPGSQKVKLKRADSSIKSDAKRSTSAGLRSKRARILPKYRAMANAVISFSSFASEIASAMVAWQEPVSPKYHSDKASYIRQTKGDAIIS